MYFELDFYRYTIEHHSVLHLMGADLNDSGHYRCRSGGIFSDVAIVNVTFDEGLYNYISFLSGNCFYYSTKLLQKRRLCYVCLL